MTYTIPVTVVVPVKDEERNIAHCLSRLGRFAHVWVIDSGSEDRPAKIARTHGAELIQFRWDGTYPKKRNWVLLNQPIPTEWVLFLDADELVDETFCAELVNAIGCAEKVGYWLQFTNYFLGTPLLHGDPQRKLALFRVGAGLYERIDEDSWSALDMEVHEHPVLNGHVGEISARNLPRRRSRHSSFYRSPPRLCAMGGSTYPITTSVRKESMGSVDPATTGEIQ